MHVNISLLFADIDSETVYKRFHLNRDRHKIGIKRYYRVFALAIPNEMLFVNILPQSIAPHFDRISIHEPVFVYTVFMCLIPNIIERVELQPSCSVNRNFVLI